MASKAASSALRAVVCGLGLLGAAVGCQSSIGGQTLPSAYYLNDDVQYFPPGPETRLFNQRQALDEYRLNRAAARDGVVIEQPPAPAP
jgi:hypothetical protein